MRNIVLPVALAVLLIAGAVGINAYLTSLWYVSTDNAQVGGTPVSVGPLNAGRVQSINVGVGSQVTKGQVLARLVLASVSNSAPVQEQVLAPFDGVVIATPVDVGATVSPGQGIVTVVDPGSLYVTANVAESDVDRLQVGQPVDVHVDALNAELPGYVQAVTQASTASFSLLPSQNNASGSFTKVTQNVPVQIEVDDLAGQPLLVGTSVEVKIHVAGH